MMIVRLNKQGLGPMAVKEQTGTSHGAIRKTLDLYAGGGAPALRPKTRDRAWLEEHKDRIEVFYLPSYSPELNPDERLNADLKHAIATSVPRRARQGLRKKME